MNKSIRFLIILLIVMITVFAAHLLFLQMMEKELLDHKIIFAYLINFLLAALVLFLVERNMKSNSAQAGFIFLIGSALKFLVFFLIFYGSYKEDGVMETSEFITFFVPYGVCLVLEVYYLSKRLNNQST